MLAASVGHSNYFSNYLINKRCFANRRHVPDTPSAMMMVPLLMPFATNLGADPVHLGMIVAVNLTLGL